MSQTNYLPLDQREGSRPVENTNPASQAMRSKKSRKRAQKIDWAKVGRGQTE